MMVTSTGWPATLHRGCTLWMTGVPEDCARGNTCRTAPAPEPHRRSPEKSVA